MTTVHLAIYDTLADWEYGYASAGINNPAFQREPGRYQIKTVGLTLAPITTAAGVRMVPDMTVEDVDPADSAMLILPGADTWEGADNDAFAKLARRFLDAGVPVAAICGATYGLAREGLFEGRDHTSGAREQLGSYVGSERYREERAVRDRGLVTAGPADALEFAREIFAELELYQPRVLDAWYAFYSTGDPARFGELIQSVQD